MNHTSNTKWNQYSFILIFLVLLSSAAYADHSHQHIKAMGLDVYLIVMPAEMIGGHQKDHPESLMHRETRLDGKGQFHISVGVIEEKSGLRIQDLVISARIITKNYSGVNKRLENMMMGGERSYGNYFMISGSGAYRVEVTIRHAGQEDALIVTFEQAQV